VCLTAHIGTEPGFKLWGANDSRVCYCSLVFIDRVLFGKILLAALRRGSAAARLLRLWVRVPPSVAWMYFSFVYCLLSRSVSVSGRSLAPRTSTECGVWVWVWSLDDEDALIHWGGGVAPCEKMFFSLWSTNLMIVLTERLFDVWSSCVIGWWIWWANWILDGLAKYCLRSLAVWMSAWLNTWYNRTILWVRGSLLLTSLLVWLVRRLTDGSLAPNLAYYPERLVDWIVAYLADTIS
jgi:hypothetical protein